MPIKEHCMILLEILPPPLFHSKKNYKHLLSKCAVYYSPLFIFRYLFPKLLQKDPLLSYCFGLRPVVPTTTTNNNNDDDDDNEDDDATSIINVIHKII